MTVDAEVIVPSGSNQPCSLLWRSVDEGEDGEITGDQLGWHTDKQSAITLLAMLSEPEDYEGGELQHEVRGEARTTRLRMGDVAVYRSHQIHRVTPVTRGRRFTLAMEFWHVPPSAVDPEWYFAYRRGDLGNPMFGALVCPL